MKYKYKNIKNSINKKVYIIIINYNGWQDTIECIESILRNTYKNYQIIIIDNNSTDDSLYYIKQWAEGNIHIWINPSNQLKKLLSGHIQKPIQYIVYTKDEALRGGNLYLENKIKSNFIQDNTKTYNPIIIIHSEKNLGFSGGNNLAIKYALKKDDFEYILLINNDTVVHESFLREMISTIKSNDANGIVGAKIYHYTKPNKLWFNGGKFNIWTNRTTHTTKENKFAKSECNFITGCVMLIRKNTIKQIGLLDEDYFMYLEDLDFCFRAIQNGYKLFISHNSKIWHKVGSSSGGNLSDFSAYYFYRNNILFMIKNFKGAKFYTKIILYFTLKIVALFKWMLIKPSISKQLLKGSIDGINLLKT